MEVRRPPSRRVISCFSNHSGVSNSIPYPLLSCAASPLQDRVVPKNIIPLCVIPIGYPAEKKELVDRFKKERIYSEKW